MDAMVEKTLDALFQDLTLISPTAFRLGSGPVHHVTPAPDLAPAAATGAPSADGQLATLLFNVLYNVAYAHAYPGPGADEALAADPYLPARMDHANTSRDSWDPGWQVFSVATNGTVHAIKGEVEQLVQPGEFVTHGPPGTAVAVGTTITVYRRRGAHDAQPGFYYIYGETPIHIWADHALFRFYFNSTPKGVGPLISWISELLNAFHIPFRMKALTDASHYTRSDSTVLYVARRWAGTVARVLAHSARPTDMDLMDRVPLFTRKLAPGIGIADDPGISGESLGMNRCRLVAEAIVEEYGHGRTGREPWMEAVKQRFAKDGLDVARPWLGVGRSDIFDSLMQMEQA